MRYLGAYTNHLYVGHAWIYFHRTRLQYIQESFSIELMELLFTLFEVKLPGLSVGRSVIISSFTSHAPIGALFV